MARTRVQSDVTRTAEVKILDQGLILDLRRNVRTRPHAAMFTQLTSEGKGLACDAARLLTALSHEIGTDKNHSSGVMAYSEGEAVVLLVVLMLSTKPVGQLIVQLPADRTAAVTRHELARLGYVFVRRP